MTSILIDPAKELVSLPQAARLFRVSTRTLNHWVHEGKIPAARTPGGHWRISRAVIDELLADAFGNAA